MDALEPVQRAMFVSPHPDDIEFSAAGTVAALTRAGKEVFYVVATNGNKGGRDTEMSGDFLRAEREQEQRAAADVLGVKELVSLDFGDGELEDNHEFRSALVYHIRRLKPDVVFAPDPFRTTFYIHRDHRMTGLVTMDAVFPYARDRLHYPQHLDQGLTVHNTKELFFYGSESPDVFVDIGATVDVRIEAMLKHSSQVGDMLEGMGGEEGFRERMKQWPRRTAKDNGQSFEYAEAFRQYGIRTMYAGMASEDGDSSA